MTNFYTYNLPKPNYSYQLDPSSPVKLISSPGRKDPKDKIRLTLKERGWVVLKAIATKKDCLDIISKQWDYLEGLGTGIERENPETWYGKGRWPGMISTGQVLAPYVGHCSAVWKARQLPKVKALFSLITGCEDLKVSYDTMNMVRPYTLASNRTKPLFPHLDQNPHVDPDFVCYQGLLNLVDSNLKDGGTMMLSGSHNHFLKYKKYSKKSGGFHIRLEDLDVSQMVCPTLETGDFLLWDGRLVHGVAPST